MNYWKGCFCGAYVWGTEPRSAYPLPNVFSEIVPVHAELSDTNVSNELAITKNLPDLNPKSIRD